MAHLNVQISAVVLLLFISVIKSHNNSMESPPLQICPYIGCRQSPININTRDAIPTNWPKLKLVFPYWQHTNLNLHNSGKTASIKINTEPLGRPYLEGGSFDSPFIFEEMHFHWGEDDDAGSEHSLDKKRFSMEIHMVFYNSKYSSFRVAKKMKDGLAVLTTFAQVGGSDNKELTPVTELLPWISLPSSMSGLSVRLEYPSSLSWVYGALHDNREYYIYDGSLTTPDYSENVKFIVLPREMQLSSEQIDSFRKLTDERGKPILNNWRPIQPMTDRIIYKGEWYSSKIE